MKKSICARCRVLIVAVTISLVLQGCAKIREIPFDYSGAVGEDYKKVIEKLETAGFSNIEIKQVDTVNAEENDKVEDIKFDKESDFEEGEKIRENAKVDVVYYSLIEIEPYLKIRFEGENEEPKIIVDTNLPDDVRLKIQVSCEQKEYEKEKVVSIVSGSATMNWAGWSDSLTPGKYSVTAEMRLEDQTNKGLSKIGFKGDTLVGKNVQIDAQNGEKYLTEKTDYDVDEKLFLQNHPTGDKRTLYLLEKAVQERYGMRYTIAKEYTGLTNVNIWSDEYSEKYTAALDGSSESLSDWYKVRREVSAFAGELHKIAPLYWIWINVLTEDGENIPILQVTKDTVEYDAVGDGKPIRADKAGIDYVGLVGYAVVRDFPDYGEYNPKGDSNFATSDWTVLTYKKDKQFYVINESIRHKTKVQVCDQDILDKGSHYGDGYLTVIDLKSGNKYIINMHNFVAVPYWEMDVETAASIGECVAEYHQKSDYWPVPINGDERAIEGEKVLLTGVNNHKIIGLVYQGGDWEKYEFQPEDLTIIR